MMFSVRCVCIRSYDSIGVSVRFPFSATQAWLALCPMVQYVITLLSLATPAPSKTRRNPSGGFRPPLSVQSSSKGMLDAPGMCPHRPAPSVARFHASFGRQLEVLDQPL